VYAPVGSEESSIVSFEGAIVSILKAAASGRFSTLNVGSDVESISFVDGELVGGRTTPPGASSTLVGGEVKLTVSESVVGEATGGAFSDCIRLGDMLGAATEPSSLNMTGTFDGLGVAPAPPDNKSFVFVGRCVGSSVEGPLLTVGGAGSGGKSDDLPLMNPMRTVTKTAPMDAMHTKRKPMSNNVALLLNLLFSS
jgi:hypothetical protein